MKLFTAIWITASFLLACGENNTDAPEKFPDIVTFITEPSDQFIVSETELAEVTRANPFIGSASTCSHPGAHLHFADVGYDYLVNIYSPVSGIIHRVTPCLDLGNGNDKYEIDIAFAYSKNSIVLFCISLEPFAGRLCESTSDFYKTFIVVAEGQEITKGQIIGQLYKKKGTSDDTHIHFMLKKEPDETFHCPNIFNSEISHQFELLYSDKSCNWQPFGPAGFCFQPSTGEDLTGL